MGMMIRKLYQLLLAAITVLALLAAYQWIRGRVAESIYQDRLRQLAEEHAALSEQYNEAVRKTAITELVVEGGKVEVRIVTAAGVLKSIPLPFDPREEIHVDYVVMDGRLWIRRVHDSNTPPQEAVVIDPTIANLQWDEHQMYGLSVYRPLYEGRWVVTATQNGALALTPVEQSQSVELSPPQPVRSFEVIENELEAEVDSIGVVDVVRALAKWE
jgi:hypothetical protein